MRIKLRYLGKKSILLKMPQLTEPVQLGTGPILVSEADAKWLIATNPKMFMRLGAEETAVDEPAEEDERPVGQFVCENCGADFTLKSLYEAHIADCEKKTYRCEECDKEYTDPRWYASHMLKKHGVVVKETVGVE